MRYVKSWVRTLEIWVVIVALVAGSFGCGFVVSATQDRTARAAELTANSAAYATALAAKDKLINQLVGSTIKATAQAADAVDTAAQAAGVAADAAGVAAQKSKSDAAEMVKLKQNQKQR